MRLSDTSLLSNTLSSSRSLRNLLAWVLRSVSTFWFCCILVIFHSRTMHNHHTLRSPFPPEGSNTYCVPLMPNGARSWVLTYHIGVLPQVARSSFATRGYYRLSQGSAGMADMETHCAHATCHLPWWSHCLEHYWPPRWPSDFPLGGPDSGVAKCNWYVKRLCWPSHTTGSLGLAKPSVYFQLQPTTGWWYLPPHRHATSTPYHSGYA